MSKAISSTLGQAPLVRRLTALGLASSVPSKRVFAKQLADQVDISNAITLSDFFSTLNTVSASTRPADPPASNSLFDAHCVAMRTFIDASFATEDQAALPAGKAALRLPIENDQTLNTSEAVASYRRFYSLHQSELERRVAQLRKALLEQLQCESDALAQVAAIEVALGPILVRYSRRCLATLPKLVGQRFEHLSQQSHPPDVAVGSLELRLGQDGWLTRFHNEIQHLLHAELSLRLQPLEGLLSCLNPEDPTPEHL